MGGDKVLERTQALPKVGPNGQRDDAPGRIRHQAAHASQLRDGRKAALGGARKCHHTQVAVGVKVLAHLLLNLDARSLPQLHGAVSELLLGEQATLVLAPKVNHFFLSVIHNLRLQRRHGDIGHRNRHT